MRFISASETDVGLKRELNEDRLIERPEIGLWAVADGMGGCEAGEVASAAIVDALAQIPAHADHNALLEAVSQSLQNVNTFLRELAGSHVKPRTIGSTVVGLAISGHRYSCFWAGDSRAYRVRGAEIVQISRDHSLVQDLVRAKLLAPSEAETHPDAHVITRAVGARDELELDQVTGELLSGDIFLLASDGVTRVVKDHELLQEVRTKNPSQAVRSLIDTVLARGAPDNATVIVLRVAD